MTPEELTAENASLREMLRIVTAKLENASKRQAAAEADVLILTRTVALLNAERKQ